jgi:hypothetical protein
MRLLNWMSVRGLQSVASIVLLAPLVGCGSSDMPTTIPVSGQVTFGGSACPGAGSVKFLPLEVAAGLPRRPGYAEFDTDGAFEATSFEPGDGLVPGTYRVQIECWKVPPANGAAGESYIAANFTPPDLLVAAENRKVQVDYEVPLATSR